MCAAASVFMFQLLLGADVGMEGSDSIGVSLPHGSMVVSSGVAMRLFLSYSSRDEARVFSLHRDLERFGHDVWRDVGIVGGQEWWDRICAQLRSCDAVVFALSPSSARSRPCEAELDYARALQRPLVPVMITETTLATAPLSVQTLNVVAFTGQSHEAVVALAAALAAVDPSVPLPAPLPPVPATPLGDLPALRSRIVVPEQLGEDEQRGLVTALRRLSDSNDDVVFELVRLMRGRSNLYESVARELDDLLSKAHDSLAVGSEARTLVKALLTQADNKVLTPVLGTGLTDALVGSRRDMARAFAEEFGFPLSPHLREDLPQVAQFVKVTQGGFTLRDRLRSHVVDQLERRSGDASILSSTGLDRLFDAAWDARDPVSADPHEVLAALPCPIYVTAHPAQLLEHALRAAGKEPVTDVCRWKLDDSGDEWPASPLDTADGTSFRPTVECPLVFHVFGLLAWPDSLVLTEDDYFKFMIGVTSQRDTKVPALVRSALADSALLILGFRLEDWDFRALWQALMSQEGNSRLRKYKHVAVQIDPTGGEVSSRAARQYLAEYFGRESTPSLDLFWGSVTDFASAVQLERSAAVAAVR